MENIKVVTLEPNQWKKYKDLRLRALKEEPQAYASSYQDNVKHSGQFWKQRLEDAVKEQTRWLVFAKLEGKLVGMVGASIEKEIDNVHIIAVYVVPEERGKGISKLLMNSILSKVKDNKLIKKITVEVNSEQLPALNLYKNSGFRRW